MFGGSGTARREGGFTWLELLVVVAIAGLVASLGVPRYLTALRSARVDKARHELVEIAHAIDAFLVNHDGRLPLTLYQVGFGGKRDPWGTPYCYLNHRDRAGDGLAWATAAGLVGASALVTIAGDAPAGPAAQPAPAGESRGVDDAAARPAVEALLGAVAQRIGRALGGLERRALVSAVAANGSFRIFTGVAIEPVRRRDRYLFPVNTDYDLFSLGPDRRTSPSLKGPVARDDVVRANNGGYYGAAREY